MLFLFLHFYNWLWTLFCSCLYFKMTVFAFLQTKSLCIFLEEMWKGKKAASRWSSGKRGWKCGKCCQELPFSSHLTANPEFLLFQRVLWACTTLTHGPELVSLQRLGENTCRDNKLYLGVDAPVISLTAGGKHKPPDHTHVHWKWFKTATLEKHTCVCLGDVCE